MKTEVDQRLQTLPNQENKVIPNQQQLAELKRDLSFWPAGENHQLICLEKNHETYYFMAYPPTHPKTNKQSKRLYKKFACIPR